MALHDSAFEYLKPTDAQVAQMAALRRAFADLARVVEKELEEGTDRDYVLRLVRTAGMWANVAASRYADGTPRTLVG